MKLIKFFSLYLLLHAGFAAAKTPETLCATNEKIVFSCSLKHNKTVSLCSSTQITATTGYLQYRFGKINHAPELEFPQEKLPPGKFFRFGWASTSIKGSVSNIAFDLNNYTYTIYQQDDAGDPESGVFVVKPGEMISNLHCNKYSDIGGGGDWENDLKQIEPDQIIQGADQADPFPAMPE